MTKILSSYISSIRGTQESGTAGFISKMKIGDSLYRIKDPAVGYLAAYIESHYKVLDTEEIPDNSSKFISGVSLDANGKIDFKQKDLPVTGVTASTATANTYIASISLSNGKVTATRGTLPTHATFAKKANTYIAAVNVDSNGNVTFDEGTIPTIPSISVTTDDLTTIFDQAYVTIAKGSGSHTIAAKTGFLSTTGVKSTTAVGDSLPNSTLAKILSDIIGDGNDTKDSKSIEGAKLHAAYLVNTLSSEGVAEAAQKINEILEELKEDGNSSYLVTIVDRLRDVKDSRGDFMNVGAYVMSKITTTTEDMVTTSSPSFTSNTIVLGDRYKVVQQSAYTISSYTSLLPTQTKVVPTASAVATYVQTKITGLNATARGNLSASDVLTDGHAIGVKVTETDGKLGTTITIKENFKANGMSYVSYADEQIEFALSYMVVKK